MKPILGIAVLLTWFARCDDHGIEFPNGNPHGPYAGHSGSDDDAGVEEAVSNCTPTDLYQPQSCDDRGNPCFGLRKYTPKYELWADGAGKERFIYLPPGTTIDTTNPDRWDFPKNTKIFKTFSVGDQRIETRVMTKLDDNLGFDSWSFIAFKWNAEQTTATQLDATEAMNGVTDHLGSGHDIPKTADCKTCHTVTGADAVNGFGAIQLNYDGAGFSLKELLSKRRLTNTQAARITLDNARIPGRSDTREALGYLHGNCGNCHSTSTRSGLQLWAATGTPELCMQPAYKDAVAQLLCGWTGHKIPDSTDNYVERVVPGDAARSGMIARMKARPAANDNGVGKADQMPKIGSKLADQRGIDIVSRWIQSRDIDRCISEGDYVRKICPPRPAPAGTGGAGGAGGSAAGAPAGGAGGG